MKGLLSCSAMIAVLMTAEASAYTGFGICNFGKETVSSVICYGPAVLKDTIVSGDVKVTGPLKAFNVTIGSMDITGTADIQNSTVKGPTIVTGYLTATKVDFQKGLTVTGNEVLLSGSTVKGPITITSQPDKPYLKVQCGASITGDVTFVGTEGVIQITDDSGLAGKIKNGQMEFVKKSCH
jgi:hypothetical protein